MTDILRLILTNGWAFTAALVILFFILEGIAEIVKAFRK